MPRRSRFLGCLLGGALGDALGAPVEFHSVAQIRAEFGSDGVDHFIPAYGRLGAITDDTQMTLFTAEGLIRAQVRLSERGITTYAGCVANAYQRWLLTQGDAPLKPDRMIESGWLFTQRELHARRAPGNTCLSALHTVRDGGPNVADNNSKGCGGVMRVAPVGLFASHWPDVKQCFELACEVCALTHGHPTGQLSGVVLAVMVMQLALGDPLDAALHTALEELRRHPDHEETLAALEHAQHLATNPGEAHVDIERLGGGWIAEEALAISVYCALVARDVRHGLRIAVSHSGDSDSTGAITGNLLGALHGVDALPADWLKQLELRGTVEELAVDLNDVVSWQLGYASSDAEFHQGILIKYPGN